jgi:hypothetical protein
MKSSVRSVLDATFLEAHRPFFQTFERARPDRKIRPALRPAITGWRFPIEALLLPEFAAESGNDARRFQMNFGKIV